MPKDAVYFQGKVYVLLQAGVVLAVSASEPQFQTLDPLGLGPERRTADEYQMQPERLIVTARSLQALFVKTDPKKLQTQSVVVVDVCALGEFPEAKNAAWEAGPAEGDRMCWKCERVVVGDPGESAFCECGGWFE